MNSSSVVSFIDFIVCLGVAPTRIVSPYGEFVMVFRIAVIAVMKHHVVIQKK